MSKNKLMIEMDEETYNITRSKIGYWLSNLLNRRTVFPYRLYSEFYEDKRIEECDDCVSRQTVEEMIKAEMPERGIWEIEGDKIKETVCEVCVDLMQKLSDLPSVTSQQKSETVTEFADRCRECGAKYGKLLKQEPCDDAVSRKEAIMCLTGINLPTDTDELIALYNERIKALQPVLPKREHGEWIKDDFTGLIKCSRCKNDAPISTVSGTQYESDFCQSCGAEMR